MTFTRFRTRKPSTESTQPMLCSETYNDPRAKAASTEPSGDRVLVHASETEVTPLRSCHQVTHTATEFGTYRMVSVSPHSSRGAAVEDDDCSAKSSFWRRLSRSGRKAGVDSVATSDSGGKKGLLASLKPRFHSKKAEPEISEDNVIEGISVSGQIFEDTDEDIGDGINAENQEAIEDVSFHDNQCSLHP
jgi:hypothetical protein